ncbi:hypothetical protein Y5S_01562 [Alcanivorax nanhaiticus]|uniref:Uncharacterized protein n=1 Tax=Alcanivorax nanhaiticus TaxID=1177154 RepID=A0A095TRZ1_9GAMM|nr:collagen-like protein [Alcanivorax nanhaiticus]KGD65128.1 hypothetical protein Y5S_01562 [Alcanivorax nanhaiticus]
MKNFILAIPLMAACLSAYAATLSDPCETADDKFLCIQEKIDEQSALIADRIDYLNTTQGPTGPQGLAGPVGPTGQTGPAGVKGDPGRNSKQEIGLNYGDRYWALVSKSASMNLEGLAFIYEQGQIEANLSNLARRLSDLNRDYTVIGPTPEQRNLDNLAYLDFPKDGDSYLALISEVLNNTNYQTALSGDGELETSELPPPPGTESDSILSWCTLLDSLFCGADYTDIAAVRFIDSLDLDVLAEQPTEITIKGPRELSLYKMGIEPDDPIYDMVLDAFLEKLEDPGLQGQILVSFQAMLAELDNLQDIQLNHYNLLMDAAPDESERQRLEDELAELTATYESERQQVEEGHTLFLSLASAEYGIRRERLAYYANKSDVLYVSLIQEAMDLFWQYKSNPVSMTQAQQDAWAIFERRFLHFSRDFVTHWQGAATAEKELFYQNYSGSSLEGLLGAPSTPDFVDEGAARVGDLYLDKQPPSVRTWQAGVAGSVAAVTTAGTIAAGFTLSGALAANIASAGAAIVAAEAGLAAATTATAAASAAATLSAAQSSAAALCSVACSVGAITGGSGASAAAGSVAGPILIVALAATSGIMEGIDVVAQGDKEKRYDELMAYSIDPYDPDTLFGMDIPFEDQKNMIDNMLYMWMITNAGAAAN